MDSVLPADPEALLAPPEFYHKHRPPGKNNSNTLN